MEAKANESVMDERMGTASMQVSREQEIASVIRAKYSIDDQIAILRQKDQKPEEYDAFFRFAEDVKTAVTAARAAKAAAKEGQT